MPSAHPVAIFRLAYHPAQRSGTGSPALLIALGSSFFFISDSILAREKFLRPAKFGGVLVMVTYFLGQLFLATGSVLHAMGADGMKLWISRILIGLVLLDNLQAAVFFITKPDRFAAAFDLAGPAGIAAMRSIGILFLMWCVPYALRLFIPSVSGYL